MKKTLLELTQDILNDLDSDEVNSINDTVEASQVASIVRSTYQELISNRNWPHLQKLLQFDASGELTKPNYLRIPDAVKELIEFKYDKKKVGETKIQYRDVKYLYPDEFLKLVNERDSTLDTVDSVTDDSGITLLIQNNKAPDYWTSFDDSWIVCDSYNKDLEATLQKSNTQAVCYVEPTWTHTDDAIPDLPSEAFILLQEEAKSTAFIVLKQMANQKAEIKAQRQNRWLSRKAWKAHGGVRYEDFGRKSRK